MPEAERIALTAARREESPEPRAWLVVAAARFRQEKYAEAVEAYRQYLPHCDSPTLRQYVLGRLDACREALESLRALQAPSERLTEEQLAELTTVDDDVHIEVTHHFVVRSRNALLSRLVAEEAEAALSRIRRELLADQELNYHVNIVIWTDRSEYLLGAPASAPEWSGGCFTIAMTKGRVIRRVDVTQLDEQGEFAARMLDRVLPHELCHLVLTEFFGQAACPLALHEGLATLAESIEQEGRVLLAGKALAGPGKIPLSELFAMDRKDLSGRELLFYAEAASFCDFLRGRLSPAEFRGFLENVREGRTVVEAAARSLGMPANGDLSAAIAAAWEQQAIADAQFVEALAARPIQDEPAPDETPQPAPSN